MRGGHDDRAPVAERRPLRRRAEARVGERVLRLPREVVRLVGVVADAVRRVLGPLRLRDAVDVQQAGAHVQRVARQAPQPLDERRRRVGAGDRLVLLERRLEDDDLAARRIGVARQRHARERDVRAVDELVDEEPVADEQRRHHAPRGDAERLDEEGADDEEDQQRAAERLHRLPPAAAGATRGGGALAGTRRGDDVRGGGSGLRRAVRAGGHAERCGEGETSAGSGHGGKRRGATSEGAADGPPLRAPSYPGARPRFRRRRAARAQPWRCLFTRLVISNIVTFFLPPNTGRSLSSALICRRFCASWRSFFLM